LTKRAQPSRRRPDDGERWRAGIPIGRNGRTTEGGETMGRTPCGNQLSPGGRSAEMISDCCPYANGKVLIEGVGEHLLPTA
jgi:hypothetical protein